jgi:hypothetical protein
VKAPRCSTPATSTTFYGYAGVFVDLDLDLHARDVAHNPRFALGDDGSLTIPDFATS